MDKEKLQLHTAIWSEVYEELTKNGIVFPKNFKGIGICYGALYVICKVLDEYNIKS